MAETRKEWLLRAAEIEDECGGVLACGGAFVDGVAESASGDCPDGAEVVNDLKGLVGYSMSHDNIGIDAITSAIRLIRIWDARLKQAAFKPMTLERAVEVMNERGYLGQVWEPKELSDGVTSWIRSSGAVALIGRFEAIAIAEKLEREKEAARA